jgi:hypothetical protein
MDDWQFNPRIFTYIDSLWGPHSIDRFATQCNVQLSRYNFGQRYPNAEALDFYHLPDTLLTSD